MKNCGLLQQERMQYLPHLPHALIALTHASLQRAQNESKASPAINQLFPNISKNKPLFIAEGKSRPHSPLRIGVVLSGGQAAGGHNVITGLFDALQKLNCKSRLFGFLNGPGGIVDNKYIELTEEKIAPYRNQGGFDLIGSGRTKIEKQVQLDAAEKTVVALDLDGLVVIGGDDSNTNAAVLAELFATKRLKTCVVGVPKTIDGDLKNEHIEISFGFDSACKIYAETIGNLLRDALSAKKYYYFVKMMGRSASHITLECALQTHPNLALIGEEVAAKNTTLQALITEICDLICHRSQQGKDYGVLLIPEGLIEFIPEVNMLINELNSLLIADLPHAAYIEGEGSNEEKNNYISKLLTHSARNCFQIMPKEIQAQLLLGRDAHGNVQVAKIETERMLIEMVSKELKVRTKANKYEGKFNSQPFYCGYEGRSCFPSNFDAQYCYALGHVAAMLVDSQANGYICCIKDLVKPVSEWQAGAYPLTAMMIFEKRHGVDKAVIAKALVDLKGKPFQEFEKNRNHWALNDDYIYPGPMQFFGPAPLTDSVSLTLTLESLKRN